MSRRRGGDGVDDLGVAGAAAEVAGDRLADVLVDRRAALVEIGAGRHEHARRADAALGAAVLQECLLERVQATGRREALDRQDRLALDLRQRHQAAVDDLTVDQHRAGAALALAAALLGAGQTEVLAQRVEQAAHARGVERDVLAVDREAVGHGCGPRRGCGSVGASGRGSRPSSGAPASSAEQYVLEPVDQQREQPAQGRPVGAGPLHPDLDDPAVGGGNSVKLGEAPTV